MVKLSLYEHLFPLTTVSKQRIVEHFDGNTLCTDRWTTVCQTLTPAFGMADAVDEGFEIVTNANTERGVINFAGKRQYHDDEATMISVARRVTTDTQIAVGFNEGCGNFTGAVAFAAMFECTAACFKTLNTANTNPSCQGGTDTCTAINTCWTNYKICIVDACCVTLAINGSVEATRTTFLPDVRLQPAFQSSSRAAGTKQGRIKYYEAYNK